jgi:hypothetical protein
MCYQIAPAVCSLDFVTEATVGVRALSLLGGGMHSLGYRFLGQAELQCADRWRLARLPGVGHSISRVEQ